MFYVQYNECGHVIYYLQWILIRVKGGTVIIYTGTTCINRDGPGQTYMNNNQNYNYLNVYISVSVYLSAYLSLFVLIKALRLTLGSVRKQKGSFFLVFFFFLVAVELCTQTVLILNYSSIKFYI